MSYDVKCETLAISFLLDESGSWARKPEAVKRLAQNIQDAIEDWLSNQRDQAEEAAKDAHWDAKIDEARGA